jgi:hypothetical protein
MKDVARDAQDPSGSCIPRVTASEVVAYNGLEGDDLKKRKEFEEQKTRQQSPKQ